VPSPANLEQGPPPSRPLPPPERSPVGLSERPPNVSPERSPRRHSMRAFPNVALPDPHTTRLLGSSAEATFRSDLPACDPTPARHLPDTCPTPARRDGATARRLRPARTDETAGRDSRRQRGACASTARSPKAASGGLRLWPPSSSVRERGSRADGSSLPSPGSRHACGYVRRVTSLSPGTVFGSDRLKRPSGTVSRNGLLPVRLPVRLMVRSKRRSVGVRRLEHPQALAIVSAASPLPCALIPQRMRCLDALAGASRSVLEHARLPVSLESRLLTDDRSPRRRREET
jgi:hypothetical protein